MNRPAFHFAWACALLPASVALASLSPSRTLINRLTSTQRLSWGSEGVELELARSLPPYAWAMLLVALLAFAAWTYARLAGPLWARCCLAGLRTCTLALLALLACGPQLVKQNERVERDWVVVLADRSASLAIADAPGASPDTAAGTPPTSRESQLQTILRNASPELARIASQRNLLVLGFDAGVFDLATSTPEATDAPNPIDQALPDLTINLGQPLGQRTALGTSLSQALQRVAARPVAGLVLLSDGRSFDAPSRDVLNQLTERRIPVFPVALGSAEGIPDFAITRVDAPASAFQGDLLPIRVDVEALGAPGAAPVRGRVQILDEQGVVLLERVIDDEQPATSLTLTLRESDLAKSSATPTTPTPRAPGDSTGSAAGSTTIRDWSVRLIADGPDLTPDNNAQPIRVELVDRPIRVLYIDGYPRWEYRYLKNLLLRERSIRSTTMLLAAEKRFIQEGTDRLDTLPRTASEWSSFDAIMLGDVRPSLFSEDQLRALREAVSQRGVGLLWIAGSSFTPNAWRGSPLADLLPFSFAARPEGSFASSFGTGGGVGGGTGVQSAINPILMEPGPAAGAYGLLQLADEAGEAPAGSLAWPSTLTDATLGWPKLHWSQVLPRASLKPASEVLAWARPVIADAPAQDVTPLIVTMRYGAARVLYVATDETWRYRYGRGETLGERLWIPMVRLLARGSLGRTGKPALIEASPDRALVNQPIRMVVRLLDQSLLDQRPQSIRTRIARSAAGSQALAPSTTPFEELVLTPEATDDALSAQSVATYSALWVPASPGRYALSPTEPLLAGLGLSASVLAQAPEDELRRPQTDHPALAQLAIASGGRMLSASDLTSLSQVLPNREVRTLGTPDIETIWDKPWALLLLLALVGIEWVGRRVIKLS